ncbi:Multiple C2 And Transmembrane Domain-Containing Protein 2 [Manis pentadactyla]|nr:Multiple C2 And Transmembrane Domain-Containing Protein 2 [Manis pentadactyla]
MCNYCSESSPELTSTQETLLKLVFVNTVLKTLLSTKRFKGSTPLGLGKRLYSKASTHVQDTFGFLLHVLRHYDYLAEKLKSEAKWTVGYCV